MDPNTSESLEKLTKDSKKLAKTSKNFTKISVKTFFTAQYYADAVALIEFDQVQKIASNLTQAMIHGQDA